MSRTVELYSLDENEPITLDEAAWILNNPRDPSDTFIQLQEASDRYFGGRASAPSLRERLTTWKIGGDLLTTPKAVKKFKKSSTELATTAEDSGLYIIGNQRHVKIGVSQQIGSRFATLCLNTPAKLELIAKFEGWIAHERNLHVCFAEYRLTGEWFERKGALARWLAKLKRSRQ